MREYGFSPAHILPYKDKIFDFFHIREYTGQWKPAFSYILCSATVFSESYARFLEKFIFIDSTKTLLLQLCNSITVKIDFKISFPKLKATVTFIF